MDYNVTIFQNKNNHYNRLFFESFFSQFLLNYNPLLLNKRHRFILFYFCFVLSAFQMVIQQTSSFHFFFHFGHLQVDSLR